MAYRPAEGALSRLAEHAGRLATRLNKPVAVVVEHAGVRIPPGPLDGFCEALVHVVRNAIDHGFESRQERLAAGKSPIGSLELLTRIEGPANQPALVVEVRDDGAGIDFGAVKRKAIERGIAFEDNERGEELMFADGFSTREPAWERHELHLPLQRCGGEGRLGSNRTATHTDSHFGAQGAAS